MSYVKPRERCQCRHCAETRTGGCMAQTVKGENLCSRCYLGKCED